MINFCKIDKIVIGSLGLQVGPIKKHRTGVLENYATGFEKSVLISELKLNSYQFSCISKIIIGGSSFRYKSLTADLIPRVVPRIVEDRIIYFGFKPDSGILTNLKNFRRSVSRLFNKKYKHIIGFTYMPCFVVASNNNLLSLVRDACNLNIGNSTVLPLNIKKMVPCIYPIIGNSKSQNIRDFCTSLVFESSLIGKRIEIRGALGF